MSDKVNITDVIKNCHDSWLMNMFPIYDKVGSEFRMWQFRDDHYREDVPHFTFCIKSYYHLYSTYGMGPKPTLTFELTPTRVG